MRNWIIIAAAIGLATHVTSDNVAADTADTTDTNNSQPPEKEPSGPVIVIDAGHGGDNVGAPSADRLVREKQFTLAVSRQLATELKDRGARVVMTRNGDDYLTLRQRSAIANDSNADIFISIHGNASPDHSHSGFETYVLSPAALDIDARALRTSGPARPGTSIRLSRLVDDVERGLAHPASAKLAKSIQANIAKVRPISPNRGVKQESMHVLLGANMPAVLVELGFIDHPVEGRELLSPDVQASLVGALADALVPIADSK